MLKTRIIPCLDVKEGRVVKGINFIDLIDAGDPVEQASYYSKSGADEICFLDIGSTLKLISLNALKTLNIILSPSGAEDSIPGTFSNTKNLG